MNLNPKDKTEKEVVDGIVKDEVDGLKGAA